MNEVPQDAAAPPAPSDLTLRQAAALYAVSARTLAQRLRCGQLQGYKTSAATGGQWRVTGQALREAGYAQREAVVVPEQAADAALIAQLRREVTVARRAAATERRRADDADRRLGHTMMECGRLRTALAAATGQASTSDETELLDTSAARWLISTIRSSSKQSSH